MSVSSIAREIGNTVQRIGGQGWYSPHMAAASRAIADRIRLADLILEIRDARVNLTSAFTLHFQLSVSICLTKCLTEIQIPFSSEFELSRDHPLNSRRIIVLNKCDLVHRSPLKVTLPLCYFFSSTPPSFFVNSSVLAGMDKLFQPTKLPCFCRQFPQQGQCQAGISCSTLYHHSHVV